MLTKHAERELKLAGLYDKDSDYGGLIAEAIMELMEVFAKQGHSGGSAPIVANLFKKLALYENLTPLTGNDDEWSDISEMQGGKKGWQNNRVLSVFKNEDGKVYYLDAIIWKTQNGGTYTGNAKFGENEIKSRQFIKEFPFTPKDFVIDVWEKEVAKDDWEFIVKDTDKLLEVAKYYDFPFIVEVEK